MDGRLHILCSSVSVTLVQFQYSCAVFLLVKLHNSLLHALQKNLSNNKNTTQNQKSIISVNQTIHRTLSVSIQDQKIVLF